MKRLPLPLSFPRACAVYLLSAAVCVLLAVLCRTPASPPSSTLCNVVLTALLLVVFRRCGGLAPLKEGKYFSKYLPLVLLFPALYLVMRTGAFPDGAGLGPTLLRVLCIAPEVLWTELLFRQGAALLFGRQETFHLRTVIFTCAVFGAGCLLLDCRLAPTAANPALDATLSMCMGVFLTALLLRTKNVLVPMTAQFLMRFTVGLTDRFSAGSSFGTPEDDLFAALLLCALPLVIGGILIARGRKAELNRS